MYGTFLVGLSIHRLLTRSQQRVFRDGDFDRGCLPHGGAVFTEPMAPASWASVALERRMVGTMFVGRGQGQENLILGAERHG